MTDRLAISIAVSDPGGGLDPLSGALAGARAFDAWAVAQGYDTVLCTDETEAVTLQRLHDEIHARLSPDVLYDRIIVYFAGHGCALPSDDFWLLSGFDVNGNAAISLDKLKFYLDAYQPRQIALIGDACRTIDGQFRHLIGSAVVDFPPTTWKSAAEVDIYRAASLGDPAYMVKDPVAAKSRCLFSEILINALAGQEGGAWEPRQGAEVVSSGQLKSFLEKAVNVAGGRLQLTVRPHIESGFRYPRDTYLERAPRAPTTGAGGLKRADGDPPPWPELGPVRGPTAAAAATQRRALERQRDRRSEDLLERLKRATAHVVDARHGSALAWCGHRGERLVLPGAAEASLPVHTEAAGLGLVFPPALGPSAPVGLKLAEGPWVFSTLMDGMQLVMALGAEGADAVLLRQMGEEPWRYEQTSQILSYLDAGELTGEHARDVAVAVRDGKHRNPVLGAIAAYLYDRVGDIDSIRQMAWFYFDRNQPIPYDVALLARLEGAAGDEGLVVRIPATDLHPPQSEAETRRPGLFGATPAVDQARVGGRYPYLRQGWSRLRTHPLPSHDALTELTGELTAAPFTSLHGDAGSRLARLITEGAI